MPFLKANQYCQITEGRWRQNCTSRDSSTECNTNTSQHTPQTTHWHVQTQ